MVHKKRNLAPLNIIAFTDFVNIHINLNYLSISLTQYIYIYLKKVENYT